MTVIWAMAMNRPWKVSKCSPKAPLRTHWHHTGSPTKPIVIDDTFDDLKLSKPKQFSDFSPAPSSKNGSKKIFPCQKETDDFWYAAQAANPPSNFTPGILSSIRIPDILTDFSDALGLIQVLKKGLLKGHTRGLVRKAALCYGGAVHIGTQSWDASWGCGYFPL